MNILTCIFTAAALCAAAFVPAQEIPADKQPTTLNQRMAAIGKSYLGTPYVARVLDRGEEEKLVICRDSVDCVTFVEYVLAEALDANRLAANVQRIRYRNGEIDGYASRLHYTSAWIENGIQQGMIEDVTARHSPATLRLQLSFMSTHPHLYPRLKNAPREVAAIARCERALSGRKVHYLPQSQLPDQGLPWIQEGDILCMTTSQHGLDIAHLGLACYIGQHLHMLHASSTLGKVVISRLPLRQMLLRNKKWTGVRVLRPIRPGTL